MVFTSRNGKVSVGFLVKSLACCHANHVDIVIFFERLYMLYGEAYIVKPKSEPKKRGT